jgi:hypothetical protein
MTSDLDAKRNRLSEIDTKTGEVSPADASDLKPISYGFDRIKDTFAQASTFVPI